jgi:hypothetical protein
MLCIGNIVEEKNKQNTVKDKNISIMQKQREEA